MAKVTDRYRYSDIDFNFAKAANGDVSRKFDNNAIKQSLRNLVLSNYYERPFRPSLGANLHDTLFSNFSQGVLGELRTDIIRLINEAEPRVILTEVLTGFNQTTSTLSVSITYNYLDSEDTIDITIERVK
tara:strand:- start:4651 stop:5040 length:390 start_codon:yes stop_codon:yes gene_type:complete